MLKRLALPNPVLGCTSNFVHSLQKKTVEAELSLFLCYLSDIVVVAFEPENACEYISHSFGIVMHVIRLHKMGPHCARRLIVDKNAGIKVVIRPCFSVAS